MSVALNQSGAPAVEDPPALANFRVFLIGVWFHAGFGALSVTICRLPVLDGQEDSLGDAQGLVDMLMELFGPGVTAHSQDGAHCGRQAHGDDLMGGKLLGKVSQEV